MKKIKVILILLVLVTYLVISLSFISKKNDHQVCSSIKITITDSLDNKFINEKQILKLLERNHIKLIGENLDNINLEKVEEVINNYPPVGTTVVFKSVNGILSINIRQRMPIIRVIDALNNNFYIDDKGFIMKTFESFTSHVIAVTGEMQASFPVKNKISVLELEQKNEKNKIFADIYRLGKFITSDKFWKAQIQQIYVNQSMEFELIPTVGSQVIILGDCNDLETKFNNLASLYKNGLPIVGWNTYQTINLKYKGQVVCTKRNQI